MTGRKWLALAIACGAVAMLGMSTGLQAGDEKHDKVLNLETAHFKEAITGRAKTVGLEIELDGMGGGTGILSLDPNIWHGKARTLIAVTRVKVVLKEIQASEHTKKGRKLYEVSGMGLDRLLLGVPANADRAYWLVIGGKEGIEDIVEMRRK